MYVNIIYESMESRSNYILKIIQVVKYRIDDGNVKGSGSDLVHSFLGNRAWLECLLNNIFILRYFQIKFQI